MINFEIFMFFSFLSMIFFLFVTISLKEDYKDVLFPFFLCIFFCLVIINEFSFIYFANYKKIYTENKKISIIELEDKHKNCYLDKDKLIFIYKDQIPIKKIYNYKAWPFYIQKEEIVLEDIFLYPKKEQILSVSKMIKENITPSFSRRISKYDLFAY